MEKLTLIENYKKWYKIWSSWIFILIGIAPDLYNTISTLGWLEEAPKPFVWTIRLLACFGFAIRLIKQEKLKEDNNVNN